MTEKRFTCETKTQGSISIDFMKDNGQIIEKFEAINLLNELHEENEQLKQIVGFLKNDNAKDIVEVLNLQQTEIWKLKKGVYNVIDNKIEEVKSHIITTPKITPSDNTSNMIFVAMIDLLLDLKKELMKND